MSSLKAGTLDLSLPDSLVVSLTRLVALVLSALTKQRLAKRRYPLILRSRSNFLGWVFENTFKKAQIPSPPESWKHQKITSHAMDTRSMACSILAHTRDRCNLIQVILQSNNSNCQIRHNVIPNFIAAETTLAISDLLQVQE